MGLEDGHELASSVDLDALHGEGRALDELVEERPGRCGGGSCGDMADGPFGHGSSAVKGLIALSGLRLTNSVSIWTRSPGDLALQPLARR